MGISQGLYPARMDSHSGSTAKCSEPRPSGASASLPAEPDLTEGGVHGAEKRTGGTRNDQVPGVSENNEGAGGGMEDANGPGKGACVSDIAAAIKGNTTSDRPASSTANTVDSLVGNNTADAGMTERPGDAVLENGTSNQVIEGDAIDNDTSDDCREVEQELPLVTTTGSEVTCNGRHTGTETSNPVSVEILVSKCKDHGAPSKGASNGCGPPTPGHGTLEKEVDTSGPEPLAGYCHLLPFNPKQLDENQEQYPMLYTGWLSLISAHWCTRLFIAAWRRPLEHADLWSIHPQDSEESTGNALGRAWDRQMEKAGGDSKKASLTWTFFSAFAISIILGSLFCGLSQLLHFCGAVLILNELVLNAEQAAIGSDPPHIGNIYLTIAFVFMEILRAFFACLMLFFSIKGGLRFKAAFNSTVYRKVMRLRNLGTLTAEQVVNLCVTDSELLFELAFHSTTGSGALIIILSVVVYTTVHVGWPALLGCVTYFLSLPLQSAITSQISKHSERAVRAADERLKKMNEFLVFVKLIKMYAWEDAFSQQVSSTRRKERSHLAWQAFYTSLAFSLGTLWSTVATAVALSIRTLAGETLSASQAFSVLAAFISLQYSTATLAFATKAISEGLLAVNRLKALLQMPELLCVSSAVEDSENSIEIENATLLWASKEEQSPVKKVNTSKSTHESVHKCVVISNQEANSSSTTSDAALLDTIPVCLVDISLNVKGGQLVGVCGSSSSGKTALLSALIGGMHVHGGSVALKGSIAYVSQQAWITNATVRENILFGGSYDQERYQRVLEASALIHDLDILGDGDQTEIGERGINLSGGQKQRVSLARALYAQRDVYLLDDPLSAVDAYVGAHIFNELIKKELAGKTVLLVTHQLQYLQSCDRVVMMVGGRIEEQGSYEDLMASPGTFHHLMNKYLKHKEDVFTGTKEDIALVLNIARTSTDEKTLKDRLASATPFTSEGTQNSLDWRKLSSRKHSCRTKSSRRVKAANSGPEKPSQAQEHVQTQTAVERIACLALLRAAGGIRIGMLVAFVTVLAVVAQIIFSFWIGYWLEQGSGSADSNGRARNKTPDVSQNPNLEMYIGILFALVVIIGCTAVFRSVVFDGIVMKASSVLHDALLKSVFRAPVHFHDSTSTGCILNCFSKDLDAVDSMLPRLVSGSTHYFVLVLGIALVGGAIYPILLAPLTILVALLILIVALHSKTLRGLKRLDNLSRSPLISHLASTCHGLSSIHAFQKSAEFVQLFRARMNCSIVSYQAVQWANLWTSLRLHLLSVVWTISTVLLVVCSDNTVTPSMIGFVLSSALGVGGLLQFTTHLASESQVQLTSMERINHHVTSTPAEAASNIQGALPSAEWPKWGGVVFDRVYMRHSEGSPLVLHGLSFNIRAQERIAVIDRTGADKSLTMCLLRLVEIEAGTIFIDNVDISTLGLNDLRSRLSIIPEDPVLFVGSIRYNLDPFNTHSDKELNHALEKTHLQDIIAALPDGLQTEVVANGKNFSVGERQLICMARALLRHSKILILDEATASIDTETDALIQRTIRDCFADCTLLTIARHLKTMLCSDRLLVMDGGRIAEFDSPARLLMNPKSMFSQMLAAGPQEVVWQH